MDMPGFDASQMENMSWAALGKKELCGAQHSQDQPPNNIFALAGATQIALEQGLIKFSGGSTYGRCQRSGCLVETLGYPAYDLVVFGSWETGVA